VYNAIVGRPNKAHERRLGGAVAIGRRRWLAAEPGGTARQLADCSCHGRLRLVGPRRVAYGHRLAGRGSAGGTGRAGEVVEFIASAAGVGRMGGSRRSAVLAMAASILGAGLGALVGVPIPIVGPFVGILAGAGLGALVGAVIGESWKGRDAQHCLRVGQAAFWGRLLGTFGKLLVGSVMVAVVVAALIWD